MNKTDTIDNFLVKYKKLAISKSIKITFKKENELLVTMPVYCPYKKAKDFLLANIDKLKNYKFERKIIKSDFKTKFDTLEIIQSQEFKTVCKKGRIYFYYPCNLDFNCDSVQKELLCAYKKALKIEAKNYLPYRIDFLAKKFGYKFNKLALKNQKTRFGSCSFVNNINLNINLMEYDFDVIDYVIIHELAHTKVKNHSFAFWQEVEKNCPNYKILRKKLKCNN